AKELEDPQLEEVRLALKDHAGFLAVPTVESSAFDPDTLKSYYKLLDAARTFESNAPDETALMCVGEAETLQEMPILIRGNPGSPGKLVARNVPLVMRTEGSPLEFAESTSGRLELAQWMASEKNTLTARVMVNRIWTWHFGQGLVPSTENFGVRGDKPSHPKLLDWLAYYFIESGWSIKEMHRLILDSSTWQMDSRHPDYLKYQSIDSENRLCWKQNLRRLQAEQIRDSILLVAGRLDREMGGKTLPLRNRQFVFNHTSEDHTTYESLRRAVYLPVIRNNLYTLFEQFDFPDPALPTGQRAETIIAPQALVLMNDPIVLDSAERLAENMLDELASGSGAELKILNQIYLRCLSREPTQTEAERSLSFVEQQTETGGRQRAWMLLCQALLVSSEFLYLR
ncbi:MAG: DUF1553 domain-containing protein, partial [Planctomycetota bacterium]